MIDVFAEFHSGLPRTAYKVPAVHCHIILSVLLHQTSKLMIKLLFSLLIFFTFIFLLSKYRNDERSKLRWHYGRNVHKFIVFHAVNSKCLECRFSTPQSFNTFNAWKAWKACLKGKSEILGLELIATSLWFAGYLIAVWCWCGVQCMRARFVWECWTWHVFNLIYGSQHNLLQRKIISIGSLDLECKYWCTSEFKEWEQNCIF